MKDARLRVLQGTIGFKRIVLLKLIEVECPHIHPQEDRLTILGYKRGRLSPLTLVLNPAYWTQGSREAKPIRLDGRLDPSRRRPQKKTNKGRRRLPKLSLKGVIEALKKDKKEGQITLGPIRPLHSPWRTKSQFRSLCLLLSHQQSHMYDPILSLLSRAIYNGIPMQSIMKPKPGRRRGYFLTCQTVRAPYLWFPSLTFESANKRGKLNSREKKVIFEVAMLPGGQPPNPLTGRAEVPTNCLSSLKWSLLALSSALSPARRKT